MRLITGFQQAKQALSRQPGAEYAISPGLQQRLLEMFGTGDPEQAVQQIIQDVRQRRDAALFDYSLKIDKVRLSTLEVARERTEAAYRSLDGRLADALKLAAERVRAFHARQKENVCRGIPLRDTGQIVRALERVGLYVPGGTAAYPSTVLMTAIPARVAGVKELILATPPGADGEVPATTLAAAFIAGVDRVFRVGGAQAIAALAYGTESIPRVDKICGPGNIFVVLAKKLVYGAVAIDGLQGPSEIIVIADETADPAYCAADLLAQAEHDALASAILITTSAQLAKEVNRQVTAELATLKRQATARQSLDARGMLIVVASIDEAIELANLYAPEHLSLMMKDAASYLDRISNAGCVFLGGDSTVVLGDYVAGPSHTLPTGGTARFSSPLNVTDFIKLINVVNIDKASLEQLGEAAQTIAEKEGLDAHARAVSKRLEARGNV
ncbi:MAG: histidinol dehydrogenase [Chloroflexi bacterium]|nr:histidinol dehydrogenase [Chloroflexota bacterium]